MERLCKKSPLIARAHMEKPYKKMSTEWKDSTRYKWRVCWNARKKDRLSGVDSGEVLLLQSECFKMSYKASANSTFPSPFSLGYFFLFFPNLAALCFRLGFVGSITQPGRRRWEAGQWWRMPSGSSWRVYVGEVGRRPAGMRWDSMSGRRESRGEKGSMWIWEMGGEVLVAAFQFRL